MSEIPEMSLEESKPARDQAESWLLEMIEEYPDDVNHLGRTLLDRLRAKVLSCSCPGCEFAYMLTWYALANITIKNEERKELNEQLKEMYGDDD